MSTFVYLIAITVTLVIGQSINQISALNNSTKDASHRQDNSPNLVRVPDWLFAAPHQANDNKINGPSIDHVLDAKLKDLLARVGPDMKPASGFRDYGDISSNVAGRAWQLLHERVSDIANDKIDNLWPHVEQILRDSGVSDQCIHAANKVASGAKSLDLWAVKRKYNNLMKRR